LPSFNASLLTMFFYEYCSLTTLVDLGLITLFSSSRFGKKQIYFKNE